MKRCLVLFVIFLFSLLSFAQENENQLALLYFSQGEYEKASDMYEKLFAQTHSQVHFDYLIACYQSLNKSQEAEKITKEQINRFPQSYYYSVKMATLFDAKGKHDDAQNLYEKIVKKSSKQLSFALEAGRACTDNKVDSVAQVIYEQAFKKYGNTENLALRLSEVYLQRAENAKLIALYFDLLQDEDNLELVENQLQYTLYENTNTSLKKALLQDLQSAIEKNRTNTSYRQLYGWILIQDKDFRQAYDVLVTLDIDADGDGQDVYDLGTIAMTNANYEVATDCFSYIVKQGPMNDLYDASLEKLLKASYNTIFLSTQTPEQQQIENLEKEYQKALESIANSKSSVDVRITLAHLQAFYLGKSQEAISLLQDAQKNPNFRSYEGSVDMELADIYIFTNDIWHANLLYASIALKYKNADIGHQAQLKQAHIAYYNGNFDYAQVLLDVLKGSTSKLIANDAFELSQLITDNTALDTTTDALSMFARGDLALAQNNIASALATFDSIPTWFPGHSLEDEILMRKAQIAENQKDMQQAITYWNEVVERFSYDIYADKAAYNLAKYYDNQQDAEKAKKWYSKILTDFPNSLYVTDARKRYREIK